MLIDPAIKARSIVNYLAVNGQAQPTRTIKGRTVKVGPKIAPEIANLSVTLPAGIGGGSTITLAQAAAIHAAALAALQAIFEAAVVAKAGG